MLDVVQQDALSFVVGLTDESVSCVITDPPHSGLEEHRARGTTTRLVRQWFPVMTDEEIVHVLASLWLKLKKHSYLWVFADARLEYVLASALADGKVGRQPRAPYTWWGSWVWVKTGKPGMGYHGRRSHEHIMMFEKGRPKLQKLGQRDVIESSQPTGGSLGRKPYPTEKPVEVLRALVQASTLVGDLVVDPFAGSGATGEAAVLEGRRFAGCDVLPEAVVLARERV